jgi:lipopolysaccharide export system permease protein
LGLLMHDARDPKQIVTYLAERALIIKRSGTAYLRMEKGHIVRRLDSEATPQIIAFDSYMVDLSQLEPRSGQVDVRRPRERSTLELLAPDADDPLFKMSPGSFTSELHERMASPLYAFAFVLIVLALMGQAQTTRQNRARNVVGAFAVALFWRVIGITSTNTIITHPQAKGLVYAVPAVAGLLALLTMAWHLYPRPPSAPMRALQRVLWALSRVPAPSAARLRASS